MKLAMQMTLDGLLRALRSKAHEMAEELEEQYASGHARPGTAEADEVRRRERGGSHELGRV